MDVLKAPNYNIASDTHAVEAALNKADKKDEELMNACVEFESYFLNMMFKEMRKTIDYSDSLIKRNQGEIMFTEMLDEENSKSIARGNNGLGLAQSLYQQMQHGVNSITYEEYLSKK